MQPGRERKAEGRRERARHCLQHLKTSLVLLVGKELSQLRAAITFQAWNRIILTPSVSLWGIMSGVLSAPGNQNSSEIKPRWIQSLPRSTPAQYPEILLWAHLRLDSSTVHSAWLHMKKTPRGTRSALVMWRCGQFKQTMPEHLCKIWCGETFLTAWAGFLFAVKQIKTQLKLSL